MTARDAVLHAARAGARVRPRRGAVLIEALIGALLVAVLLAAAFDAIGRVMRAGREQSARASARVQLEQAATAIAADLRTATTAPTAVAPASDDPADLRALADTAVELDATIGGGIACATAPASTGSTVDIATAPELSGTPILAWWAAPPRPGDLAFLHDNAGTASPTDDHWTVRTVRAVSEGITYCRSGAFATAVAASIRTDATRFRLTLDSPVLAASVGPGSPVRIARRRRYSLYRATDGWQLGVRDWDGSAWETIQPVAGPFASPTDRGLLLGAVDAAGAPVQGTPLPPTAVELRVLLRAPCAPSDPRLRCVDSALAVVRPRGSA